MIIPSFVIKYFVCVLFISSVLLVVYTESIRKCNLLSTQKNPNCGSECFTNSQCWQKTGAPRLCYCDRYACGNVCIRTNDRCQKPRKISNGLVQYRSTKIGAKVKYKCKPGFSLIGRSRRFCLSYKKWSHEEPICTDEVNRCFRLPEIDNARVTNAYRPDHVYKNDDEILMICNPGFNDTLNVRGVNYRCSHAKWISIQGRPLKCSPKNCGKAAPLKNGIIFYPNGDTFYGSRAHRKCKDGYFLKCDNEKTKASSSCEIQCTSEGVWSDRTASCERIVCPKLDRIENGILEDDKTDRTLNTAVYFKCNYGYELIGPLFRICGENGKWSGSQPICQVRSCGIPPKGHGTQSRSTGNSFGNKTFYRCIENAVPMLGSRILTCTLQKNKTIWLPKIPLVCKNRCLRFTMENTNFTSLTTVNKISRKRNAKFVLHGDIMTVVCKSGYKLEPPGYPICNDGKWTSIPKCVEANCYTRPKAVANAIVVFHSLEHGAMASYRCHYGYKMRNSTTNRHDIICDKGKWLNEDKIVCDTKKCKTPKIPENGLIYEVGTKGRFIKIEEKQKFTYLNVIRYACKKNYRVEGPIYSFCLGSHWSPPEVPKCVYINHDELPLEWFYVKPLP